tara:strand:- start:8228 stop:9358 length:1131 start_codon:yes stop_codon:yes gene_type:complete
MTNLVVPVNEPLLTGNEKKYLLNCIETGWISSEGPYVCRFEEDVARTVSRKYGIAVSNGSVALDLAIAALGIAEGDEVIIPTNTIISCAAAVLRSGAKPVVVDCCPDTFNMRPQDIKEKINSRTKAIMVVHIFGITVDIDPILKIAEENNLYIIEDAAEMMGQHYKDKPCGSFGDISTFSFYSNKHITTGEGGMVVTNSKDLSDKCRYYRNLCFDNTKRFQHEHLGWNMRLTNMQAAIGVAQLEQLDKFVSIKKEIGENYTKMLEGVEEIQLPLRKTEYCSNNYWVYPIVLKDKFKHDAIELQSHLAKYNIGTRPFFWPIHQQNVFKKIGLFKNERYPVSERIAKKGFYIPSGMALTLKQQKYVVKTLKKILNNLS